MKKLCAVFPLIFTALLLLCSATAQAATLQVSNPGLGVETDGTGWSAANAYIYAAITGKSTGLLGTVQAQTTSATITNLLSVEADLSFTLGSASSESSVSIASGGYIEIDGKRITASMRGETLTFHLAPGDSISIVLQSGKQTNDSGRTRLTLNNIVLDPDYKTVLTLRPGEHGGLRWSKGTVTDEPYTFERDSKVSLSTLEPLPDEGWSFLRWMHLVNGEPAVLSYQEKNYFYFYEDDEVWPEFTPEGAAVFAVGEDIFLDLGEAIAAVPGSGQDYVLLVRSGTMEPGEYTIPSGVTLYIPSSKNDQPGIVYSSPIASGTKDLSEYARLTVPSGTTIHVEPGGIVNVHAREGNASPYVGTPVNAYSVLELRSGAELDVAGSLYVSGAIVGSGHVTLRTGAESVECLQLPDYKGGSFSFGYILDQPSRRVFPVSQFFITNILVPMEIQDGASARAFAQVPPTLELVDIDFVVIGQDGLFEMDGGVCTREYDSAADKMRYTFSGASVTMNHFTLENMDTAKYFLPMNAGLSLSATDGTVVTVQYDTQLMPGAEMYIDDTSSLVIEEGARLVLTDIAEWADQGYVWRPISSINLTEEEEEVYYRGADTFCSPITADRTTELGETPLNAASIVNDGTITVRGALYTTAAGASITGSGGGRVVFEANARTPEDNVLWACSRRTHSIRFYHIDCVSALLKNADGSFTATAGASAGTVFRNEAGQWAEEPPATPEPTSTPEPTATPEPTPAPEEYTLGDADGDGDIDERDAALALLCAVGRGTPDIDARACDTDGDDAVTPADAALILRRARGALDRFPAEPAHDAEPLLTQIDTSEPAEDAETDEPAPDDTKNTYEEEPEAYEKADETPDEPAAGSDAASGDGDPGMGEREP